MKVYFIYTDKNGSWNDCCDVPDLEYAETELIRILANFNRVEKARYGKDAVLRTFKCLVLDEKKSLKKKKMDEAYDALVHGPTSQEEKMRRFSKGYVLVGEEKYYLVSVKEEYGPWDPVAFFKKSKEKDEFGFMVDGDPLRCPNSGKANQRAWTGCDGWIFVQAICQKCWGAHRERDSTYNCILRSRHIKQYIDGHPAR